jgi:hypothetical protein
MWNFVEEKDKFTWKEESMLSFLCPREPAFVKNHANLSFKYISFGNSCQHSSASYNDYFDLYT